MFLKRRHIIIIALAVAGIGASLLLVPNRKEMALMQFKSDRFADAYRLYQAQMAEGDLSWDATSNLADEYLKNNNVNDAIKVIEAYLNLHPRQMQARKKLSLLYQFAKREDDYIRNLETMAKLVPDAGTLEKLSQAYSYTKQYDKQIVTLQTLVKINGANDNSLYSELATTVASHQSYDEIIAALQAQLHSGKLRPEVANEISNFYLGHKEYDKASAVIEILLKTDPGNLKLLRKLASSYQNAKRWDNEARVLETIIKLQPSIETFEQLVGLYSDTKQYGKEAATLKKLIALEHGKNPSRYNDLAYAEAAVHNYAEAVDALRTLHTKFPEKFTFDHAYLLVACLLDDGKPDAALREATGWVEKNNGTGNAAKLIGLLHFKGNADMARALLRHFNDRQINGSGALLEQYVLLMSEEEHKEEVYQRLKSLELKDALPAQVNKYLLFMAEEHEEHAIARNMVACMNLAALPEEELLSLVELAQSKNDAELLATIKSAFPPAEYAKSHPVLLAVLAVAMHDADAPEQLKKLDALNLASPGAIHVARVCAYVKNYDCTNHFLDRVKSNEGLSDAEMAAIGAMYFQMNEQDTGYLFIAGALKAHPGPLTQAVAVQYDAARGDTAKVTAWLKANPSAGKQALADLYYAAANHHQSATAVIVAEKFHQRYDIPLSRSLLADAYVKTGQFEEAANLLRPAIPLAEADEDNYVNALSALSYRKDYRRELGRYVAGQLAADIPEKRKMGLTYVAINAHAITYAMPYIEKLAKQEGGQWAWICASELDKEGKYSEARPFWVQLANEADTSAKDRLGIGYTLLGYGFKTDAENIFFTLAQGAPADSGAVQALLYLWGPRPNATQLAWLERRYAEAEGKDKDGWAKLIANVADDSAVIDFARRRPESLLNDILSARYFNALAARGELAAQTDSVIAAAQSAQQAGELRQFAIAAQGNGLSVEARRAWETLLALKPGDGEALRQAGSIALGQGDKSTAKRYLTAYFQSNAWQHLPPKDVYHTFFDYAELLHSQHQEEDAKPYYRLAITLIDSGKLHDSDAQTVKALSQIRLGDAAGGLGTFEDAVAADPGNANLRADWISALIDLKRYDEAKNLLAIPPDTTAGQSSVTVMLPPGMVVSYELHNGGRELLLTMKQPVKGNAMQSPPWKGVPWISYIGQGYNTLLIVPKPGTLLAMDARRHIITAAPDKTSPAFTGGKKALLRFAVLNILVDLNTGHTYAAVKATERLLPDHAGDPSFLSFAAGIESAAGNWPRATQLITKAQKLAPQDMNLARYGHDIIKAHAPNVMFDTQLTRYGSDSEFINTISADRPVKADMQMGAVLQNATLRIRDGRRPDGSVGQFSGQKQRGEAFLQWFKDSGTIWKLSLFGNERDVGIGAYDRFLSTLGETLVAAEWHKPYWDILEAIRDDANRDRLAVSETLKPTRDLTVIATPGINRYNSEGKEGLATSLSATLTAVYTLEDGEQPLSLVYVFDGEFVQHSDYGLDASGAFSRLFPMTSREVHTLSLNRGFMFNDDVNGVLSAGYSFNQIGGIGSAALSASLNWAVTDTIDMQFRAAYGFAGANTGSASTTFGGFVRWRF